MHLSCHELALQVDPPTHCAHSQFSVLSAQFPVVITETQAEAKIKMQMRRTWQRWTFEWATYGAFWPEGGSQPQPWQPEYTGPWQEVCLTRTLALFPFSWPMPLPLPLPSNPPYICTSECLSICLPLRLLLHICPFFDLFTHNFHFAYARTIISFTICHWSP